MIFETSGGSRGYRFRKEAHQGSQPQAILLLSEDNIRLKAGYSIQARKDVLRLVIIDISGYWETMHIPAAKFPGRRSGEVNSISRIEDMNKNRIYVPTNGAPNILSA